MWRPDTGRFGGPTEHTGKTLPGGLGERRSDLVAASGRACWGQDSKISAMAARIPSQTGTSSTKEGNRGNPGGKERKFRLAF